MQITNQIVASRIGIDLNEATHVVISLYIAGYILSRKSSPNLADSGYIVGFSLQEIKAFVQTMQHSLIRVIATST